MTNIERERAVLRELNCSVDRTFRCDDLPNELMVIIDDTLPTHITIDGTVNRLSINVGNKTIAHVIYDVYHAIGEKASCITKMQKEADNWIEKFFPETLIGIKIISTFNMACDKYAIEKSGFAGKVADLLPYKTIDEANNVFNNLDLLKKEIEDYNKSIDLRRKYMTYTISEMNSDKRKSRKKATFREEVEMKKNLETLAILNGYNPKPKDDDESEKKKEPALPPMVECCKRMHLSFTTKDTFEDCCKRIIKAFTGERKPEMFIFPDKMKKETKEKEIHSAYTNYAYGVENFLKPWYKKYSNEYSMIKRGPIREMISRVFFMYICGDHGAISENVVNQVFDDIRGISSNISAPTTYTSYYERNGKR